jgi:transmembrane sensor
MSSALTGSAADVEARAADWLMRQRDCGEWSEDDQKAFDAWLAESPAHLIAHARLYSAWSYADRLAAMRPSVVEARAGTRVLPALFGVAAALCIAVFIVAALFGGSFFHPDEKTYVTSTGGHQFVALADGSHIELNTDTSLRVAMQAGRRTVWLDRGEAYFQIKHDAAHPFVVMTGDRRITDLGTEFLIRRETDHVEVALISGRAWFDAANGRARAPSMLLAPGDDVISTEKTAILTRKSSRDLADRLSWRQGVLVFNRTALSEVAAEFNRYNHRKLVIADQSAARITIGGTFEANNVAAFADVVKDDIALHVEKHADEIVISR